MAPCGAGIGQCDETMATTTMKSLESVFGGIPISRWSHNRPGRGCSTRKIAQRVEPPNRSPLLMAGSVVVCGRLVPSRKISLWCCAHHRALPCQASCCGTVKKHHMPRDRVVAAAHSGFLRCQLELSRAIAADFNLAHGGFKVSAFDDRAAVQCTTNARLRWCRPASMVFPRRGLIGVGVSTQTRAAPGCNSQR